jgi:hypothetical protein
MTTPDPNAVKCSRCGCLGNSSCGHEPLDKEKCCTLDQVGVCPCCRAKERETNVLSCGCHETTKRTTRAFKDADGGPLFVAGYTCKCGRCFYKKPEYGNWSNAEREGERWPLTTTS